MSELQATVEFSVELHKFYNVDLFQRGFYQVRTSLKVSPKLSVKIEVNLARNQRSEHVFPPFITNGCGVSRTFQILYRNEEVLLDNVMLFRVHLLVDSHKVLAFLESRPVLPFERQPTLEIEIISMQTVKVVKEPLSVKELIIEETLERADFALNVELWFTEQTYGLSQHSGSCVSVRTLNLHFSPIKGLHYHLPVLFDYFHLAAVTITIHAVLVALHQPYINTPRSAKPFFGTSYRFHSRHSQSSVDTLFFGNMNSTKCVSSGTRLAHARHVHKEVCSILLTTYDTLQSLLQEYMKLLPSWQQLKLETNDCLKRRTALDENAKLIEAEDDFISVANSDIAQLCAENILLWQQFLDAFTCRDPILQYLAKNHHQLRVKRFAEAFFVVDNPRQSAAGCYDANYQNYIAVSETVRRSRYLASLPSLPVTCLELDGDIATMPIIFEDQYQDVAEFARRRKDALRKSGSDPFLNAVSENITQHCVKEEDCSCGIVAILESRSQKNSSHIRSTSTSQQNFVAKNLNPQISVGVLKVEESDIEKENVVKATLTLGSTKTNAELITNISTLLLKYKEQENGKILAVEQCKTLPARQRHSKSLDQLKNTGVFTKQVPTAPSNSITRSTSSQMPSNIPNSVMKVSISGSLKVEINSAINSNGAATSPSTDSENSIRDCGKKLVQGLGISYSLCDYPVLSNSDFCLNSKMKHLGSTLSMPNTSEFLENNKFSVGNNSESMPNLIQTPCDSPKNFCSSSRFSYRKFNENKDPLALYEINDSTIIEETVDDNCAVAEPKPTGRDPSSSSPMSSFSDEITSEQSGWVSNSSRHSSGSQYSSGALSPETTGFNRKELPDYSTLQMKKIHNLPIEPVFDGDMLIEKLEQLVVTSKRTAQLNNQLQEDLRLPPPQQFRDVPSPPEHFRDPPPPAALNCQSVSEDSVDNLLYHFYDLTENKKMDKKEKVKNSKASVENLTLDIMKESKKRDRVYSKRSKRKQKEKSKVTSDEGFDELEEKLNGSDTSTVDSMNINRHKLTRLKNNVSFKNPFHGYMFKEDIDTLRKTYEKERKSNIRTKEFSRSRNSDVNGESKRDLKLVKDKSKIDCDCYDKEEKIKHKNLEDETSLFLKAKEEFKRQMNFTGMLYSDFPTLASTLPYFHISDEYRIFSPEGLHLIVCVHGLDGNSNDLRLVKTYVELGLPGANLEFLMSERNQGDTFSDFETMTDKLVAEILYHVDSCGITPSKISFIGHSLGNIIIRSAITRPQLKHLLPRFHTFLSLSGPHLGTLYNNSGLVNMGMWFMQKWKKSGSLLQLSLKDTPDIRRTFLYRLSQKSNLHHFKHLLLCGSSQDRYVPMHSARIELCKAAIKDTTIQGAVYREMVHNIIYPVINSTETTLVRYDIHHALPNTANSLIGRAAHIAVLDSELFIEKFLVVTGLKYFR